MKDPYKILGIEKDATPEIVKKTFRKLALQYHPDKNPDNPEAEEKFKEINSAYETLSNPETRQRYDTDGTIDSQPGFRPGGNPFDIMYDIINGPGFWNSPGSIDLRGQSIRQTIKIDFMDAAKGTTKKLSIDYPRKCSSCRGNGSKDGTHLETCTTCQGFGKIGQNRGMMQILHTCPTCIGKGKKITELCSDCKGKGVTTKNEILKVTIPPGIAEGTTMRLAGKGMPSSYGADNGDLLLSVIISPHPIFERDGITILSEQNLSYIDAILGTKIPVETIHGLVDLTIPPGTQPNNILRIAGQGVIQNKHKGDHLVRIKIKIPTDISEQEKELLKRLKSIKT